VVAAALEGVQNRPYVFTKCERVWNERGEIGKSLKADSIRRECEASLKRLRVDVIDLYQIHWPEPAEDVEEGWETLNRLKTEGKVRWIGVSNFDAAQLARASTIAPVASLQPPYSMLRRDIEESILPYCLAHGIGTIVYSPMQSGLLTGSWSQERMAALPADDWRKEKNRHFQPPLFERNLQLVEVLRTIAARHGATPGQVAIAWTLRHPAVTAAIVGARKPGQLRDLVPAATLTLTATDLAAIDDFLKAHPES
jgi:aryl-alcohol dehydrogenase-like predicted oxidoreductase